MFYRDPNDTPPDKAETDDITGATATVRNTSLYDLLEPDSPRDKESRLPLQTEHYRK